MLTTTTLIKRCNDF